MFLKLFMMFFGAEAIVFLIGITAFAVPLDAGHSLIHFMSGCLNSLIYATEGSKTLRLESIDKMAVERVVPLFLYATMAGILALLMHRMPVGISP